MLFSQCSDKKMLFWGFLGFTYLKVLIFYRMENTCWQPWTFLWAVSIRWQTRPWRIVYRRSNSTRQPGIQTVKQYETARYTDVQTIRDSQVYIRSNSTRQPGIHTVEQYETARYTGGQTVRDSQVHRRSNSTRQPGTKTVKQYETARYTDGQKALTRLNEHTDWSIDLETYQPTDPPTDILTDWSDKRLIDWLNNWSNHCIINSLIHWIID